MGELAGTAILIRLVLRRDRVRIPLWVGSIVGLVIIQALSIKGLYPEPGDLERAATGLENNAAFVAMSGPTRALDTTGGRVTWEIFMFAAVVAALMNMFMVTRHTRAEEESERGELVRSTVVGRHAPLAAALAVAAGTDLVLVGGIGLGLVAMGLGASGSFALGAGVAGAGLVFAGVGAVTAQVTDASRAATGMAGAGLALSYVLRAVGDVGDGTLTWFSPLGWAQSIRPFAGERWWVLLLIVGATGALVCGAVALENRRDLGAGLARPRPGPPQASPVLVRPVGLALRLQRGSLIGWTVGLFLGGLAYGSVGDDVDELVGDSQEIQELMAQGGGSLTDSFLATTVLILALVGTGYAIQSTLRLRGEEVAGRAEPLLATALSRLGWAASHLTLAAGGTVIVLAAAGVGTGLSYGLAVGEPGEWWRLGGIALAYVPAVLVLVGLTVLVIGFAPGMAQAAWALLAACLVVGLLGELLQLPTWVRNLSPFQHVPLMPADDLTLGPLIGLALVAVAVTSAGLIGLQRRDVG